MNLSALSHWGAKSGLHVCGFTDQCHFLLSLGIPEIIEEMVSGENDVILAAQKVSVLRYVLLADMGIKCKVLIQEKGGCSKALSGLSILPPIGKL